MRASVTAAGWIQAHECCIKCEVFHLELVVLWLEVDCSHESLTHRDGSLMSVTLMSGQLGQLVRESLGPVPNYDGWWMVASVECLARRARAWNGCSHKGQSGSMVSACDVIEVTMDH